ncbi:MAG: carbohydrate kinase [Bacteroidales bacterium]|nr:carbohydrate kinase [Bacteroidales bacterium]
MEKYIVGMGEALWDCLPEGRKIGGAPANFAYHSAQFGFNSLAVSAIGKDELGDEIVETFDQNNLKYCLERVDYPTGTVQVTLDEKGIPCYEIMENVAWDNIPYSPELEEIAKNCVAVCFGSLAQRNSVSQDTINRFLDAMPTSEDVLKVFDINLRQHFYCKETIVNSLNKCNILKINDEELVVVSEMFGYEKNLSQEEACRRILNEYNLRMLILTCGTEGSYVLTADETSFQPTPKVEVADTVGAGDSFTGSFIASVLKGRTIVEAHKRAVEVSAYVCTQNGAMPQMPADLLK